MRKLLKAWVLKRKLLDEFSGEVGAVLQFFYDPPPPPSSDHYVWIRMQHLDEKQAEEVDDVYSGSRINFDNPSRY